MPELTMHLVIESFGGGTLYSKTIDTPFCPRKGERIVLFAYEGDGPDDGPMGVVKEVYWHADGGVSLDLEHYVVDPTEQMESVIRSSLAGHASLHGWYSDRDDDLAALLVAGGWTT